MTFEEALKAELKTIPQLKVYPLVAPKGEKPTFVVYTMGNVKFKKTLSGIDKTKGEANCILTVVTTKYETLKSMSTTITDLIISFFGRALASGEGPVITNLDCEILGDKYEPEVDFCRADIQVKVNY